MKKLLMLGTSKGSCEMVEYAKSQGYYTIVTDPRSPLESRAKLISDAYWMLDIADVDALEKKCREEKIDGICCGISTFCIPIVMELCNRLNLPAYGTPESWHYTMNKYDFKALCRKHHVPVATDYFVSNPATEQELDAIKLPVMVKAVDQSANRGMSYCYKKEDILPAIHYAHEFSDNEHVVIERMLHGIEYTAYYALSDGKAKLISLFSDLSDPSMPNKCYAVNSTACDQLDLYLEEVHPYFLNVLKDGGFKDGVCWIELMLDEDGHFYVIEMGYRMTGDMMAIPIQDVYGFNSYQWLVDLAMSNKQSLDCIELKQNDLCGCAYIIWSINAKGKIARIKGLDKILSLPNIRYVPDVYEGSKFVENQYLLTFIFTKSSVEDVCRMIKTINETISVIDEDGNDVAARFTDFEALKNIYYNKN